MVSLNFMQSFAMSFSDLFFETPHLSQSQIHISYGRESPTQTTASSNSVRCAVLASLNIQPSDYGRNNRTFVALALYETELSAAIIKGASPPPGTISKQ